MPEPPAPSEFARRLASIAVEQHRLFNGLDESDEPLRSQIKRYWETLGLDFPNVGVPWSAVFVSFCVKSAGATNSEFKFSAQHSQYVHAAINDPGAFKGFPINQRAVNVGDIIQRNRGGDTFDFAHAKADRDYNSHADIVVARGVDGNGKFATTVGGNLSNSVRQLRVQLNEDGTVRQRQSNPFICLLECLK